MESLQQKALALVQLGAQYSLMSAMEFEQLDGFRLIQQVLRTSKASVGQAILKVQPIVHVAVKHLSGHLASTDPLVLVLWSWPQVHRELTAV